MAKLPKQENGQLNTDVLFGRAESQLGVIELLERGTLLIDNAHLLNQSERDRLIVAIQASGGERYLSTAMFEIPELISLEMSY